MHVFVTGGTGTIGVPVVTELLGHGHTVLALARSDESEQALKSAGAEVLRGGLGDLDVLRAGAAQSDGVVSLAFGRDYATADALARSITEESAALGALGEALIGSDRPIVTVSGTPWVPGRVSTEGDPLPTDGPVGGRGRSITALFELAARGVRPTAVRMPRTVHRDGRGGFAGLLTDSARRTGVSGYPGDGTQRWPAVHALDAAVLFRLALESAPAGTSWHAVADEGDRVVDIAAVIGRLGLPVQEVPEDTYGPFGPIFAFEPARVQYPHPPGARLGADPPEPARRPGEPAALTPPDGEPGRRPPTDDDPGEAGRGPPAPRWRSVQDRCRRDDRGEPAHPQRPPRPAGADRLGWSGRPVGPRERPDVGGR